MSRGYAVGSAIATMIAGGALAFAAPVAGAATHSSRRVVQLSAGHAPTALAWSGTQGLARTQRLGRYLILWPGSRTLHAGDRIQLSASPASPSLAPQTRPTVVVKRVSQATGRPIGLLERQRLGRRALRVTLRRPG